MNTQAVLSLDEGNYMALVFSGKAALELGKREEAKQFYKKAIAANAEEQLAWKVKIIVGSHASHTCFWARLVYLYLYWCKLMDWVTEIMIKYLIMVFSSNV